MEKIYDLLHSSPVKSSSAVYSLEGEIINKISLLDNAVRHNEPEQIGMLADTIYNMAEERNRKLRTGSR